MSEQFTGILDKGVYISLFMNFSYIICFILIMFLAIKGKLKKKFIYISVFVTFILSQGAFETWWFLLNKSISNPQDSKWLADHDGGGVIGLFIFNCLKAFLCLILSKIVANIITKKKGLGITKESTEFVPNR